MPELDAILGQEQQNQPTALDLVMQEESRKQAERARIESAGRVAASTTPMDTAGRLSLGAKTGVSPALLTDPKIRASYEEMAKNLGFPVERLLGTKTGEWAAQDPDNAALAQTSFDPMLLIEGRHKAIEEHRKQVDAQNKKDGVGWWHGMANSFSQGANSLLTIPGDLFEVGIGLFGSRDSVKAFQDYRKLGMPGTFGHAADMAAMDTVGRENTAFLKSGPQRAREDLLVRDPKTGEEYLNWGSISLENVTAMVAQEAPAFAAAAALAPESGGISLAPYLTKFGRVGKAVSGLVKYSTKAPALLETARTATAVYNDGKQQLMAQGLSEEMAGQKAAPGALLAGVFSSLAGSPMEAKFFEDLVENVARTPGGFGLANQLRARAKAFLSMGSKEGAQEVVQGIGEDLAQWLTFQPDMTIKQAAANAVMNFVGGFAMGGPSGGVALGSSSIRNSQNIDFMNALHEGAQNSEVYKLMPERWQNYVDHLTKDGPVETIGMPVEHWNTFWQSQGVDPALKALELGVTPTEYQQAVQLKGDLQIKTAEFAGKIAGTEAYNELHQDLRFQQGEPTLREEALQKKQLAEDTKAIMEKFKAEPENPVLQQAEALKQELIAAGRPEKQASAEAALYQKFIANLAAREGIAPEELAARYRLTVQDGKAMVSPAAATPAPAAPQAFRSRQGGANPMTVDAVHFSPAAGITALDPSFSGKGTKGAEAKRLQGLDPADPLRQSVYLYASKGGAVPTPERLVTGKNAYQTRLDNVYNIEADPEGIWAAGADANAKERAVVAAGYDGYWSPSPGQNGSVVLLGTGAVPVQPITEGSTTLFQSERGNMRQARQIINKLETNTYAAFKDAMRKELGSEYQRTIRNMEFNGEKGDKALKQVYEMAQVKEMPGAPPTIRTDEDRQALVDRMVEMAVAGESGRFWYDDSAKAFMDLAGGDRLQAFKLATLTALYSPQAGVADNGRRAILAYYDAMHNMAVSAGGVHPNVKELAQRVMDGKTMEEVQAVMSGQKTSAFQQNLLNLFAPEHANDDMATIDLHMMRAFGYDSEATTPAQYKWAEQLTREVALELGWGSPKEAQAAIWVAQKMKTDNKGKGSEAGQAGFHYGDAARKIAGAVNVEAMPGSDVVRSIFPGIGKATRAQLEQYHAEKMAIVLDTLKQAGVMVAGENTGHGYWEGVSNPVTSFLIPLPHIGSEGDHNMAPSARAEIERAAKVVLDLVGDQDAIGWNKPFATTSVGEANATHYALERALTVEEMQHLGDEFNKAGFSAFIDAADPKNLKVINYDWKSVTGEATGAAASKLAKAYHNKLNDVIINALPDGLAAEDHLFNAQSGLVSKEAQNASETEARRLPAEGAPTVQAGDLDGGRAKIEALNERFRTEYGWGTEDPADTGTRGGQAPGVGQTLYQSEAAFKAVDTASPEFRSWFGKSQVVDENGQPLKVYHGTLDQFGAFNTSDRGIFFSTNPDFASFFGRGNDGRVVPAYLKAEKVFDFRNPADIKAYTGQEGRAHEGLTRGEWDTLEMPRFQEFLHRNGYDGYYVMENGDLNIAVFNPSQIKSAISNIGTYDINDARILYQPAYHGSPYKFDKFSLEHLGKGEGAQAYGWGLYFAGDQSVARWYHENLSSTTRAHNTIDGKRITKGLLEKLKNDPNPFVKDFFAHSGGVHGAGVRNIMKSLEGAIEESQENAEHFRRREEDLKNPNIISATYTSEQMAKQAEFYERKAEGLKELVGRLGYNKESKGGQLYKVDIPGDDVLLDQNSAIGEQSPEVRKAIESVWSTVPADKVPAFDEGTFGWTIYQQLSKALGSDEAASKALNEAGVKGMRYRDGNSRTMGYGQQRVNYNYVIFDDAAVKVLDTYYQPDELSGKRGFLQIGPDHTFNLGVLEKANVSTVSHELAHFYAEVIRDLASRPDASPEVKADWDMIVSKFGKDGALDREGHESFADTHLAYLQRGVAPSEDLRPVFQRFSNWLTKIWAVVKAGAAEMKLDPEVTALFDRLYASSQEIEVAKNDLGRPMFATAEAAGMTAAEFKLYTETEAKRIADGKETLIQKLMAEMQREQSKERRALYNEVKARVTDEVLARPEYQALMALVEGITADGVEVKLNREALVERGIDPLSLAKDGIRVVYTSEGGMDAESAAMFLGYESGDALLKALAGLESRKGIIERLTREEVAQQFPDTTQDPQALRNAAIESLSESKNSERVMALELQAIRKKQRESAPAVKLATGEMKAEQKQQAKAQAEAEKAKARDAREAARQDRQVANAAAELPNMPAFRAAAANMVQDMVASTLSPYRYLQAQRKAGNEAFKLMAKNDYEGASEAKEREIMNHFLYLESVKARDAAAKFQAFDARFDKRTTREKIGKAGGSFLEQIDAVRARFGLSMDLGMPTPRTETLAQWAAGNEFAEIDDRLLDETWTKPLDKLTVSEMNLVWDALKNIKALAYNEFTVLKDGKRVELQQIEGEIAASIAKHNTLKPVPLSGSKEDAKTKAMRTLRGFDATMTKIEQVINWMDGNDVAGPAHRYLWDPLVEAQTRRYDMTVKLAAPLQEAFAKMPEAQRKTLTDTFTVDGFNQPLTRAQIISMLFNLGNAQNQEKLLKGYDWSHAQVMDAVGRLNAADAAFVQSTWDTIETLWPEMVALEKRYTGVEPKKVEVTPFTIYDDRGQAIAEMSGGYWPLKYDPNDAKSDVGRKQQAGKGMLEENYSRPGTSRSATKERTRYTGAILLDFQYVLQQHLNDVIMDLSHREALNDVDKVLKRPGVKSAIQEAFGPEYYAQFNPWLKTIAGDSATAAAIGLSTWNRAFMAMRSNTIAAVLGFKFTSTIVQVADVLRVIAPGDFSVKPGNFASAFVQFVGAPKETLAQIHELSGEMRHRAENMDRDIHAALQQMTGQQSLKDRWNRAAFKGLAFMDAIVSGPAWLGAYQQAMAEHGDSDRAVSEADRVVRLKLMSGNPKDLVGVQRSNELMKMVTMFLGDASAQYNMMRNAGHKVDSIKQIPQFTMAAVVVMAGAIIGDLLKGAGPGDDDDKVKWALRKATLATFETVPVLRDGVKALDAKLQNKPFADYQLTPAIAGVTKVLNAVDSTADLLGSENPPETIDWAIKAGEGIGYAFGIGGTAQIAGGAKYLRRVDKGEERPDNEAEQLYYTIQGKPKKGTR